LRRPREPWTRSRPRPRLRFSPTAWAKLLFLRDRGPTEVGGFGIAPADDLLYVQDIHVVRQTCTTVFVFFEDSAVAEFFDDQIDAGRRPEQFGRLWIHTHPGESAQPSHVDEETFQRVFGHCDWGVMFILAREGQTYCRLRFRAGPGGAFEIPVQVDFHGNFTGSNFQAWTHEYETTVRQAPFGLAGGGPWGLPSPRLSQLERISRLTIFSTPSNWKGGPISMSDRYERQRDMVPQDRLAGLTATVIGVGAIGRQIALQLADVGVPRLQLIDFDRVETTNITTQGYYQVDIGQLKVAATRRAVEAIDPAIVVETCADRFRPKQSVGDALFCAVDSISARASIWRAVEHRCRCRTDGRMLGETIRVLCAADGVGREHYASTLFLQSEAQAGRCTSRSTIYASAIAAGLMVHQFTLWLRDLPIDGDTTIDLLAGEWAATSTDSHGSSHGVGSASAFSPNSPTQGNGWEHVKS